MARKEVEEIKVTYKPVAEDTLLSIQDLHVWFELRKFGFSHAGYVRAVDGVSFDLKKGETVAVVGESGCGKSSLMKTILGVSTFQPKANSSLMVSRFQNSRGWSCVIIAPKLVTSSRTHMVLWHPS